MRITAIEGEFFEGWLIAQRSKGRCAVALETNGGESHQARIVVGGVATEPWRLRHVEVVLIGPADKCRCDSCRRGAGSDGATLVFSARTRGTMIPPLPQKG